MEPVPDLFLVFVGERTHSVLTRGFHSLTSMTG